MDAALIAALARCPSLLRVESLPGGELAAWLAPGAALATALTEVCRVAALTAVNSSRVSLHEIFVEAVGKREEETR